MKKLEILKRHIESNIEYAEKNIAAWSEKFNSDPAYALEWAESVFTDAAKLKVSQWIKISIEYDEANNVSEQDILDDVHKMTMNKVLSHGRYPAKSTSVPHNVMDREYLAAWSSYAELFENRF